MIDTARLDAMISDGRLLRGAWTGTDAQGRETACLLAALSQEVAAAESASACPAEIMPAWLAHLTPWIDDAPSADAWPGIVRRYAAMARRWHVLDAAAWERVRWAVRGLIVREAMRHTTSSAALDVCERVAGLCEARSRGEPVSDAEMKTVRVTARELAAVGVAARAAVAVAEMARAVAEMAVAEAARAAVRAEAEALAAAGARSGARAAADRICFGILGAIEAAVEQWTR